MRLLRIGVLLGLMWSAAEAETPTVRIGEVHAVLRAGFAQPEFWVRMHAAEGLTAAGEGAWVRRMLGAALPEETDDQRRCGLARELVRAGDPDQAAVMLAILADSESNGRVHAAESLFKVGWSGEAPALWAAMAPAEPVVLRIMAAAAWARHGGESEREAGCDVLRSILSESADPAQVRLAAWALGRVGDESDIERMAQRKTAMAEHPATVTMLTYALALRGDAAAQAELVQDLWAEEATTRTYAAVFVGEAGVLAGVPALIEMLDDPHADARIRAAHALIKLDVVTL